MTAAQGQTNQTTGQRGEALAEAFLVESGWVVEARNWRWRGGELDLVVRLPGGALGGRDVVAIVEVKARRSRRAAPEAAITRTKRERLARSASAYARAAGLGRSAVVRIDVVAVDLHPDGTHTLRHHPAAVDALGRLR